MNEQPEALRLADAIPITALYSVESAAWAQKAAAELRRLHVLNQELVEALEEICSCPQWVDEATVPKAGIESAPRQVVLNMSVALMRLNKARAAIQKAKGEIDE